MGLPQLLKQYSTGDSTKASRGRTGEQTVPKTLPKTKAKAKAAPKVVSKPSRVPPAVPQFQDSTTRKPQPHDQKDDSIKVNIGSMRKKGKTSGAEDLNLSLETGCASGLCDADKAILHTYETKMHEYQVIKPPLADAAFKQHLMDLASRIGSIAVLSRKKIPCTALWMMLVPRCRICSS